MSRSAPLVAGLAFASAACSWIAGIEDFQMTAVDGGASESPSADGDAATDAVASDGNTNPADVATVDAPSIPFDADDGGTSCACAAPATCFQNSCYPRPIATGLSAPQTLAVVGTSVVWAEPSVGTVRSCPTSGCVGAPTIVASGLTRPTIQHGGIGGVPVVFERSAGASAIGVSAITAGPSLTMIHDASDVMVAAASATFAMWQSSAIGTAILTCARSGSSCISTPSAPFPSTIDVAKDAPMAMDGSRAFISLAAGGVGSCTLPSCGDYTSFSGVSVISAMVTDATDSVVVVPGSDANMLAWQLASTSIAATLPVGATPPRDIAADSSGIFVATVNGTYGVARLLKPAALAQRTSMPAGAIAIDATFVYWTEPSAGRIMVAPR